MMMSFCVLHIFQLVACDGKSAAMHRPLRCHAASPQLAGCQICTCLASMLPCYSRLVSGLASNCLHMPADTDLPSLTRLLHWHLEFVLAAL